MIKRIFLALAFLAGLASPAFTAGTIGLSLTQQFGTDNKPLNGGKLYFYAAGTTTPQNAYQDSGLTIPWPNPLTLNASGRVPQLFFADGQIKVRLANADGLDQFSADNLLVVGPSGGGGGGGSVDPTTIIQTGNIVSHYGTGVRSGFVRLNGRTIGNAVSGATERANADCQALFEYLWNSDPNLAVPGGRGVSAASDWATGHQITLPDMRNRVLAGLGDMGSGNANRLSASYFGASGTTLGAVGGVESITLSVAQMPTHNHNGVTSNMSATTNPNHNHGLTASGSTLFLSVAGGGTGVGAPAGSIASDPADIDHYHTIQSQGGSQPHATVQPTILITTYMKL